MNASTEYSDDFKLVFIELDHLKVTALVACDTAVDENHISTNLAGLSLIPAPDNP